MPKLNKLTPKEQKKIEQFKKKYALYIEELVNRSDKDDFMCPETLLPATLDGCESTCFGKGCFFIGTCKIYKSRKNEQPR